MASSPALRAFSCQSCRLSTLRILLGDNSLSRGRHVFARKYFATPSAAPFSTFRSTAPALRPFAIEEQRSHEGISNDNAAASPPAESNGSEIPWYLEVEPPRHPTLLHEAPPLPDIPDDSPKLMEPLVKFTSDDLGLDDLTLLDLRELDPPPALGPDLMMLFGTARSERHLHVSADRLVRWLRGHGISAKADGLLGRNELKTKLRRQARKAKLLGNSGVPRGGDDGISTGWICVNLGTIGSSDEEAAILDERGRPTGFGVAQLGTTIVVQVMTESRRQELNLEKLWTGLLKRGSEKSSSLEALEKAASQSRGHGRQARAKASF
ncbi:hypothetical protein QBC47DRAFT_390108 [Echria macrotheca]|uniref:ATPase synthesis protein 25 n=1 Tax=Echria macrotheca TaxID=438768 RepID=A0AAJ0B7N5_9PEZI|nr:hypothetical protein QBC47DRAFT_390108 [Echria macrotheca]